MEGELGRELALHDVCAWNATVYWEWEVSLDLTQTRMRAAMLMQ